MGSFPFGWALNQLWAGLPVARKGWNGKGMWISLQVPGLGSKMNLPYIYMKTAGDQVPCNLVPWVASHTDLLSDDWYVVTDE